MMRVASVIALLAVASANIHDRAYYEAKFFDWMKKHGISAHSATHFVQMLTNFANNDDLITMHNAKNLTYSLGHNQFSHMTFDEWKAYVRLGLANRDNISATEIHRAPVDLSALADSVDWTERGAVTPVKDQGQCGSCWSFSTTGALEGAYFVKHGTLTSFSEQNLVDCDNFKNGGTDMGCNGGLMDHAFKWVAKNGGLCTEVDYPYTSGTTMKSGSCSQDACALDPKVAPSDFVDVETNSDAALMSALNIGPVAVAIEADQVAFQLYKEGVFTGTCGTNLDHGVLAVGYGSLDGVDFWKVKNSWGPSWGQEGYILLQRGSGVSQKEGQCGILSGPPSYPKL